MIIATRRSIAGYLHAQQLLDFQIGGDAQLVEIDELPADGFIASSARVSETS